MVSARKRFFSSVHRLFLIENTLPITALVPGIAKENSKMSCVFFNEIHHFAQTWIFQTSFQNCKWFCIPFIHSGFTYICNMNKFIRYVTLSNSSKVCCMAKGAMTFTTMDSHFVRPHENFSSCNLITKDVQSVDQQEWLCFTVWNAKSFFDCNMFTLTRYSFFGKKDVTLLL
jgi:hypothetical protein